MRTRAAYRLVGDDGLLTAENVTAKLGIEPTTADEAGTRIGQRSTAMRQVSLWTLSASDEIEHGVELADQLQRLLAVLEPRTLACCGFPKFPAVDHWNSPGGRAVRRAWDELTGLSSRGLLSG